MTNKPVDQIVPNGQKYMSMDYSSFILHPQNRILKEKQLQVLIEAIKKKDLLIDNPILITKNRLVLDGQYRLTSAKALGKPIYYMYAAVTDIDDVADINGNRSSWTLENYLNFYLISNKAEYFKFQEFRDEYPEMGTNLLLRLSSTLNNGLTQEMFRNGSYPCNNLPDARRLLRYAKDFKEYVKFWDERSFLSALYNLIKNPEYEHKRMMHKMEFLSSRLTKCADMDAYLSILTDIYNHGIKTAKEVTFRKRHRNRE